MLDSDLAMLYGVETRVLNQAVKRNIERFPKHFMFQLTYGEFQTLISQIVISKDKDEKRGGRQKLPYVFTEQGVAMLSSILNSEKAIEINIQIIRAFVNLRKYTLQQTLKSAEIEDIRRLLLLYIEKNDKRVDSIIAVLNSLIETPREPKEQIGFNRAGFDVRDFRGGESRSFFASKNNIEKIANLPGVESFTERDTNDYKAVSSLIKQMKPGREYILATGKHQAVIRKNENGYQYLELQSPTDNGWKPLTNSKFKDRFECQKSHSVFGIKNVKVSNCLIDVESLSKSNDFHNLLGYINTNKGQERKGANGSIK